MEVIPPPPNYNHGCHAATGGYTVPDTPDERRLRNTFLKADVVRPLVPAAVKWPSMLEPDFVACAPSAVGRQMAAFSALGRGAMVSEEAALGKVPGVATPFTLEGL